MNAAFVAGFVAGDDKTAAARRRKDEEPRRKGWTMTRNQRIILEEVADAAGMLLRKPSTARMLRRAIFWGR